MGWKKIKEHYGIRYIVNVREEGVYIGSDLVHNLMVINPEGEILRIWNNGNDELRQLKAAIEADRAKFCELLKAPDQFDRAIDVYTWKDGEIVTKQCEEPGWPNVTHDGILMYDNRFFADRDKAVQAAKQDAVAGISCHRRNVAQLEAELRKSRELLAMEEGFHDKLAAAYPENVSATAEGGIA